TMSSQQSRVLRCARRSYSEARPRRGYARAKTLRSCSPSWSLTECLSQKGEALGDRYTRILFALELQGYVAPIVVLTEDGGDAGVIQVKTVPQPAAVVGFRLDEHRLRRNLLETI